MTVPALSSVHEEDVHRVFGKKPLGKLIETFDLELGRPAG
jgi:hypothetical protein